MEKKNIWIALLIVGVMLVVPAAFFAFTFFQVQKSEELMKEITEQVEKETAMQYDLEKNYCVYLYPDHIRLLTSETDEELPYEDFSTVLKTQLTDSSKTILLLTNKDTDASRVSGIMNTLSEQQVTNYDLVSE